MQEYRVFEDPQSHQTIVCGNFVPGSVAVNLPRSDQDYEQYVSLFAHKESIENGIDTLRCISYNNIDIINRALFVFALTSMMKCFQCAKKCKKMELTDIKESNPSIYEEIKKYREWRDRYFIHEENSMRESAPFLPITPEDHSERLGGLPSVVWEQVSINFVLESENLKMVLQEIWKFIVKQIDEKGEEIRKRYKEKTREELLSFGQARIKQAHFSNGMQEEQKWTDIICKPLT